LALKQEIKMREASKTNQIREANFSKRYLTGNVLDIGAGADLVCPWARGFDVEDGDANFINNYFPDESFDTVHSSHSLEHMSNPVGAIFGWWKLVKSGGFLIVVVPDEDLYEQGIWPSFFSSEHKSTFRLGGDKSWSPVSYDIKKLAESLPNAQVVSAIQHSHGFDHSLTFLHGTRPKKIGKISKVFLSILKRIPYGGSNLKEFVLKALVKNGYPYDQTANGALAQIEIIVKKCDQGF
jgi:SAM-dependent methyltransferase